MPNHITNRLTITGPEDSLDQFVKENVGTGDNESPLDFERSVPMPENLPTTDSIMPGWYGWRLKNWGTKWNAYEHTDVIREPKKVVYGFDTAWSPPTAWICATSKKYPLLIFDNCWYDENIPVSGRDTIKNGDAIRYESHQRHETAKEFFQIHFPFEYEKIRESIAENPEYFTDWDWGENPHSPAESQEPPEKKIKKS